MAVWVCRACTTAYAVGAPACPHCGSTDRSQEGGSVLPTIEVACETTGCVTEGTPRRVMLRPVAVGLVEMPALLCAGCGVTPRTVRPWPPLSDQEADMPKITRHGGATNAKADPPAATTPDEEVPSSPGSSSQTSTGKPSPITEPSSSGPPKPAPTTESRSGKARTGSRTARSTGGGRTARTSAKPDGE